MFYKVRRNITSSGRESFLVLITVFALLSLLVLVLGNISSPLAPLPNENLLIGKNKEASNCPKCECKTEIETNIDWKRTDTGTWTAEQLVEYFSWSNSTACNLALDFGGILVNVGKVRTIDGQHAVCMDKRVAPSFENGLVYSFGINDEWSFDDMMEAYGITDIFAFDPSMKVGDHNRTKAIRFYRLGLSDGNHNNSKGWKMMNLESIYTMLGHESRIIDYLKIDIEKDEWHVLPQIVQSGMLSKVRQLGVEVHLSSHRESLDYYRSMAAIIQSVEDAGMIRFDLKHNLFEMGNYANMNNYEGSTCFDLAWYQVLPYA